MAKNTVPDDVVKRVLRLCREGQTASEIGEALGISRNQAIGVIAKRGGAETVRGWKIQRSRLPKDKPVANRVCYFAGCNRGVTNGPATDYRMCEVHRRAATESYSGLGNVGEDRGKRNGSVYGDEPN